MWFCGLRGHTPSHLGLQQAMGSWPYLLAQSLVHVPCTVHVGISGVGLLLLPPPGGIPAPE
jgi:hypothetical protein